LRVEECLRVLPYGGGIIDSEVCLIQLTGIVSMNRIVLDVGAVENRFPKTLIYVLHTD
jgi:hypothetical protein